MTVLIDPARKQAFEKLCYSQDFTPSQVLRHLIRDYIEQHLAATKLQATRRGANSSQTKRQRRA